MIKKISDELLRYIYTTLDRKKCYSIRKIIVDWSSPNFPVKRVTNHN